MSAYDRDMLEDLSDADLAPVACLIIQQLADRGTVFADEIRKQLDPQLDWQLDEAIAQLEDM
jgi:hypothetical protein